MLSGVHSQVLTEGLSSPAVPLQQFNLDLMFGSDLPLPWPFQAAAPFPFDWTPPRSLCTVLATQHSGQVCELGSVSDAKLRAAVLVLRGWRPWSCKRGSNRAQYSVLCRSACYQIAAAVTIQRYYRGARTRTKMKGIYVELWASRPVKQCLLAPTVGKFWVNQGGSHLNMLEMQQPKVEPQPQMSAGSHRAVVQLQDKGRTAAQTRVEAEVRACS